MFTYMCSNVRESEYFHSLLLLFHLIHSASVSPESGKDTALEIKARDKTAPVMSVKRKHVYQDKLKRDAQLHTRAQDLRL